MVDEIGGRLTLESGVPVSTTDQANKTTLYYTPYHGNRIALYDGAEWLFRTFAELSLAVGAFTASKPYDIFCYDNAGTPALEALVWTDGTTRATALAYQDGILVKSGAATRRYLGTIYIDSGQKCQDTLLLRYVWNYYHRVHKRLKVVDTTDSWSYATNSLRSWNNSTANRVTFIVGLLEDPVVLRFNGSALKAAANNPVFLGIGEDSVTVSSADIATFIGGSTVNTASNLIAVYDRFPAAVGYHYLQLLEDGDTGGTTFYGDNGVTGVQSGATGYLMG